MKKLNFKATGILMGLAFLAACDKTDRSFSLLADGATFQQSPTVIQRKIDILWVVDNSGSMKSSQTNLTDSFSSFINRIQTLNFDFHMAVTSTDAWRGNFSTTNPLFTQYAKQFRRGPLFGSGSNFYYSPDSGVAIMDNTTANLSQIFVANATLGIQGSGDERAFASFKDVLDPTFAINAGFRRPDAFLAIIIVSDEDDFSVNTNTDIANGSYAQEVNSDPAVLPAPASGNDLAALYQDSRLYSVESYKTFLDSVAGAGNYSVSTISIMDTTCKADLNASSPGRRIGRRYMQLADITAGVKTSLCDNFGTSLQLISDSILELSSVFKLEREPNPATINVIVNGTPVAEGATNGWTYDQPTLTITFHGTAVPPSGATVQITFDPLAPKN